MKILVIGGMHGNEPLGIKLAQSLKNRPIAGVAVVLANPRAASAGTRFTDQDLNRSFPGTKDSSVFESRRANKLMRLTSGFDLVLDFHNTLASDNDCSFIGANSRPMLLQVATFINLPRVIVADYDCINKYAPNCLSVEISLDSPLMSVEFWRSRLSGLAAIDNLAPASNIKLFRYVYTISNEERDQFHLTTKGLQAFQPIQPDLARQLGITSPAYPIFIGQNYTDGVYAGILNRHKN